MNAFSAPHTESSEAFDHIAGNYDQEFERLPATQRLRHITSGYLLKYFKKGDSLLELACGTGTDAITLARNGIRVLATDSSPGMIEIANAKVESAGLTDLVSTRVLEFNALNRVKGHGVFDGAYSNFGGLNCTAEIKPLVGTLYRLIKPEGYLIINIMTRFCLWETCSFLIRGNLKKAFRRLGTHTVANLRGQRVRVYYYFPTRLVKLFVDRFQAAEIIGLSIFTPPPTSDKAFYRVGKLRKILEGMDGLVSSTYPFNSFGDHCLLILRRND